MMFVYNEADIVGQVIDHLFSHGIELVVMDNGSNDGSYQIIKDHIGNGTLAVQRMESEKFEAMSMLRILHAMAIEYSPDWLLLTGADEFLESPYRGLTLSRAIQLEEERGFNMIQFNNFEFFPTEKDYESKEVDVQKRLRYYSWQNDEQFRCWKMCPGLPIFETHGHESKLPGEIETNISPNKFILRHYKIRSYEHGLRKIFNERLPRYSPAELRKGWHKQYDNYGTDKDYFVIDSSRLTRYDEDGNWNLAKTFDGSFGTWNPLRYPNEKIAQLQNHIDQLENSLSLRIGRKIPLGRHIHKVLSPNDHFDSSFGHSNNLADYLRNVTNRFRNFDGIERKGPIKYSFILSTVGKRETLQECLNNFNWFVENRHDTELVIATTSPDFTTNIGRVYHFKQPKANEMYFLWRQAAENANGEIVIKVDDDVKLSKNFLDRCDEFFANQETMMVQPALVDAEGYIILNEHIRTYTISALRRRLVRKFNLGYQRRSDIEFIETVMKHYPNQVIFDNESFALHYGYLVKGGIDSLIAQYNRNRGHFDAWIIKQRAANNHKSILLNEFFV